MKNILQRLRPIIAIGLSALVLLFFIGMITGIWVVQARVASSVVNMLGTADNTAQIMRDGIVKVDTGLETLAKYISSVEAASAQLSQNITDKGLVLSLLPTGMEQELTTAVQSVQDDLTAIRDSLNTFTDMAQAIDRLPFIALPDLASVNKLQSWVSQIMTQVDNLKAGISEFRSLAAANTSKITEAITNLNSLLTGFRADLALVDTQLSSIQTQSRHLQKIIPTYLLLTAIVVTLMGLWIGYSQVMMILRAVSHSRSIKSLQAANLPEASA